MSDIKKYMKLCEGWSRITSGVVQVEVREEDVHVHYEAEKDMDGEIGSIEWYIEGLGTAGTHALGLSPDENQYVEEQCLIDIIDRSF